MYYARPKGVSRYRFVIPFAVFGTSNTFDLRVGRLTSTLASTISDSAPKNCKHNARCFTKLMNRRRLRLCACAGASGFAHEPDRYEYAWLSYDMFPALEEERTLGRGVANGLEAEAPAVGRGRVRASPSREGDLAVLGGALRGGGLHAVKLFVCHPSAGGWKRW